MPTYLKNTHSRVENEPSFSISNLRHLKVVEQLKDLFSRFSSAPEFSTFEAALAKSAVKAYEEEELLEVIRYKTKRYVDELSSSNLLLWESMSYSMLGLLNAVASKKDGIVRVLDFGGACGSHYFQVRKLLDKSVPLHWVVVETPGMVNVAKEFVSNELMFSTSIDEASKWLSGVDVVHSSGTLHFVPQPWNYLDKLLKLNSRFIVLNRLGFYSGGKDIYSIHKSKLSWNGIGPLPPGVQDKRIAYPTCFLDKQRLESTLNEKYSLIAKFVENSGVFKVSDKMMEGGGYIYERKP